MIDKVILFCLKNGRLIRILLVLTTLIILVLTMLPQGEIVESDLFEYDKIGHFLVFFGWTLLFGLFMFTKKKTETKFLLIFLAGCTFGVMIEVFQGILPLGRTMNVDDVIADFAGSLTAIGILFLIKRRYLSSRMEKQLKKMEK